MKREHEDTANVAKVFPCLEELAHDAPVRHASLPAAATAQEADADVRPPPLLVFGGMLIFPARPYTFYLQHTTASSSPFPSLWDGTGCGRGKNRRTEEYDCSYV